MCYLVAVLRIVVVVLKSVRQYHSIYGHILFGHKLLIKVYFGDTFSGALWPTAHLRNLRIPI